MTVVVIATIHGVAGRRDELHALMTETAADVAGEPGCVSYRFAEVLGEPGTYVNVQEWRDEAAMDGHFRGDAFARYQRRVAPLLARPSETRLHHVAQTVLPEDPAPMDPRLAD